MLEIDILFNLFPNDCMFITFTTKNSKYCSITYLIVIGHTHGLEGAWRWLVIHIIPLHWLFIHINLNGFVRPMANTPTMLYFCINNFLSY